MAGNIRRFVADRTLMLAAIGHDLRTPITRLRLRAELMEDDRLRPRMLADLAELEAMITAPWPSPATTPRRSPPSRSISPPGPHRPRESADSRRRAADNAAPRQLRRSPGPSMWAENLVLQARWRMTARVGQPGWQALTYGGAPLCMSMAPAAVSCGRDDGPGIPPDS
jgi:signal transduction histidine kinase